MSCSTVRLNGKFVGGWPYGYASFELDLTPYLEYGKENVLAMRMDNPPDSSRWYPGGGIYRNVWLVKTAPVHVGHWATFITTPDVSQSEATVNVKVSTDNNSAAGPNVTVSTQLYERVNGQKIGKPISSSVPITTTVAAGASNSSTMTLRVNNPKLWNLQRPNLYVAVTTVEQNGHPIDGVIGERYETVLGIRTIKFDVNSSFFLNGEHVRILCVCK